MHTPGMCRVKAGRCSQGSWLCFAQLALVALFSSAGILPAQGSETPLSPIFGPMSNGFSSGIGFRLTNTEELSAGAQVTYVQDITNDAGWSTRYEIEAYAPVLIYNIPSGRVRSGLGDLFLQVQLIADPNFAGPVAPVFHPSGTAGIELSMPTDGEPELDYFGELDLFHLGGPKLGIELPGLTFRYDVGEGLRFSNLFQTLNLFAPPSGCTPGSMPDRFDCTFDRAEIIFRGESVPEPSDWSLLIVGFALFGSMLRRRHSVSTTRIPQIPRMG